MSSKTTQNVNTIVSTVISVSVNVIFIAVVVMGIYFLANKSYSFGNAIFNAAPVDSYNGRTVVVTIPENAKLMEVARLMKNAGVVKDEYVFAVQILISGDNGKVEIAPGTYSLSTSMLPSEIIKTIESVPAEE